MLKVKKLSKFQGLNMLSVYKNNNFVCMFVYTCLIAREARRGCQIPQGWSYSCKPSDLLWSSARAESTLASEPSLQPPKRN